MDWAEVTHRARARRPALPAFLTGNLPPALLVVGVDVVLFSRFTEDPNRMLAGHAHTNAALVIALGLLAVPLLALRRRAPVVICVALAAHAVASTAAVGSRPLLGLLLALSCAAAWRPLGAALGCLAAVLLAHSAAVFYEVAPLAPNARMLDAILVATVFVFLDVTAFGVGRWQAAARERARSLWAARDLAAAEAVRLERVRIARELHDIVASGVSAIILTAAGTRQTIPVSDPRVSHALEVIEGAGQAAAKELDRLLGLLRAVEDSGADAEPVVQQPRLEDLPSLVALARGSGLDVRVTSEGSSVPVDASISLAAYRTVQEALTNAAKHGGPGARVEVHLGWSAAQLTVAVRCQPAGHHGDSVRVPSSGRGLVGLTERIKLLDGTLHVGGNEDGSFVVRASLPVSEEPAPAPAPAPGRWAP